MPTLKYNIDATKAKKGAQEIVRSFERINRAADTNVRKLKFVSKSTLQAGKEAKTMNDRVTEMSKAIQIALGPLSGIASRLTAFAGLANNTAISIAGLISGFILLGTTMHKVINAGIAYESEVKLLDARMQLLGGSTVRTTKEFDEFARQLGRDTLASASGARKALITLSTTSGLVGDNLKRATVIAQDLASLGFGSLETNARKLVRILSDPAASSESLRRIGVNVTQLETALLSASTQGERLETVLRTIETVVGGAGMAEAANTVAGAWDTLLEEQNRLFENIAVRGGVLETLKNSINSVTEAITVMNDETDAATKIGSTFNTIIKGITSSITFLITNLGTITTVLGGILFSRSIGKRSKSIEKGIKGIGKAYRKAGAESVKAMGKIKGGVGILTKLTKFATTSLVVMLTTVKLVWRGLVAVIGRGSPLVTGIALAAMGVGILYDKISSLVDHGERLYATMRKNDTILDSLGLTLEKTSSTLEKSKKQWEDQAIEKYTDKIRSIQKEFEELHKAISNPSLATKWSEIFVFNGSNPARDVLSSLLEDLKNLDYSNVEDMQNIMQRIQVIGKAGIFSELDVTRMDALQKAWEKIYKTIQQVRKGLPTNAEYDALVKRTAYIKDEDVRDLVRKTAVENMKTGKVQGVMAELASSGAGYQKVLAYRMAITKLQEKGLSITKETVQALGDEIYQENMMKRANEKRINDLKKIEDYERKIAEAITSSTMATLNQQNALATVRRMRAEGYNEKAIKRQLEIQREVAKIREEARRNGVEESKVEALIQTRKIEFAQKYNVEDALADVRKAEALKNELKSLDEKIKKQQIANDNLKSSSQLVEAIFKLEEARNKGVGVKEATDRVEKQKALDAQIKKHEKLLKYQSKLDSLDKTNKELKDEIEATQLVTAGVEKNIELAKIAVQVKNAETLAEKTKTEELYRQTEALQQYQKAEEKRQEILQETKRIQDSVNESINKTLSDIIFNTKDAAEALRDLSKMFLQSALDATMLGMFGGKSGGGFGGFLADFAGKLGASIFAGNPPELNGALPARKPVASANGNIFLNGDVIPFAKGGVIGSPTMFPMRGGKTGLMGEAGAEAIMPLKRLKGGRLGVESTAPVTVVNVNVENNTNSQVRVEENRDENGNVDLRILVSEMVAKEMNSPGSMLNRSVKQVANQPLAERS